MFVVCWLLVVVVVVVVVRFVSCLLLLGFIVGFILKTWASEMHGRNLGELKGEKAGKLNKKTVPFFPVCCAVRFLQAVALATV